MLTHIDIERIPTYRLGLERGLERGMERGLERGTARGTEQGIVLGEAEILLRQLKSRFGSPTAEIESRIRGADRQQLEGWADRILDAHTCDEVFE